MVNLHPEWQTPGTKASSLDFTGIIREPKAHCGLMAASMKPGALVSCPKFLF